MTDTVWMVLTETTDIPNDANGEGGRKTGFFMEEMAVPYFKLKDAGYQVKFATPTGGVAQPDPTSLTDDPSERPEGVQRFMDDEAANALLNNPAPVSDIPDDAFAIFLPGGHGTMWDFRASKPLAEKLGKAWDHGAVIGSVCHGPASLIEVKDASGTPIVRGRKVNGFTDEEEHKVGLVGNVPYLLETELKKQGALFEHGDAFTSYAVRDGRLVTGQNPASSDAVADLLLEAMAEAKAGDKAA